MKNNRRFDLFKSFIEIIRNDGDMAISFLDYTSNGNIGPESLLNLGILDINSIDDSYIGDLFELQGGRNYNLFGLFLKKMIVSENYSFPAERVISKTKFHNFFLEMFNESKDKLSTSDIITLYLDCFYLNNSKRRFIAASMSNFFTEAKAKWLHSDWFACGDSKDKLDALKDYAKKRLNLDLNFCNLEDVDIFFDAFCYVKDKDSVEFHFSKIRSLFNNRKHRKNTSNVQVSLQLSPKADKEIERLKKQFGFNSRSETVELILLTMRTSGAEKYLLEQINLQKKAILATIQSGGVAQQSDLNQPSAEDMAQAMGMPPLPETRTIDVK